jgi:hypothetical protein
MADLTIDAFISHASEDKDEFVRPLAQALQERGYCIWYDEFSLTLGDSLRRSIDRGLADAKFGIIVLSPNFFKKEWPQRELDGLTAKEIDGRKVILPIWHKVSKEDILRYYPVLADKLAVNTSQGFDRVVSQIVQVLGKTAKTNFVDAQGENTIQLKNPQLYQESGVVEEKLNESEEESDEEILTDLLTRSGRAAFAQREALCIKIGIDPDELDFLNLPSNENFAVKLIKLLHKTRNMDAICKLCKILDPVFKGGDLSGNLAKIKKNLNCL